MKYLIFFLLCSLNISAQYNFSVTGEEINSHQPVLEAEGLPYNKENS